jgi:hypothetical protein
MRWKSPSKYALLIAFLSSDPSNRKPKAAPAFIGIINKKNAAHASTRCIIGIEEAIPIKLPNLGNILSQTIRGGR